MVSARAALLLLVRLAVVLAERRSAEDRIVQVVERGAGGPARAEPHPLDPSHKLYRSRHRVWHRSRGLVPSEAEIRCYCNLPACLTTGYICQSMVGSCFSETTDTAGRVYTEHGCLELLSRHKQHICQRLHSENKSDLRLRCCTEDMCNVADTTVDDNVQVTNIRNSTLERLPTPPPELVNLSGRQGSRSGELWLRAATIAVPIAGLFILAVLVLAAVRMLRRESKPPQYQYAKAPLCLEAGLCESPARLLPTPAPADALVDPHRTVCCVYAADPRCPHAAAGV